MTGTHAANTQRARTEAKLAKLKLVLEAGRLDRGEATLSSAPVPPAVPQCTLFCCAARRMKALEASGNVQDMIIRTVKEREEARRNIHSLPLVRALDGHSVYP